MASYGFPCDEFNFRHAFKLFYGDSQMLPSVKVDVPFGIQASFSSIHLTIICHLQPKTGVFKTC